MVATDDARMIFQDARFMYDQALERLNQGDLRDAAEKAWCATKRATDALILSRTNQPENEDSDAIRPTTRGLKYLAFEDEEIERLLVGRYFSRMYWLHGECFYRGLCDPVEDAVRRIRETSNYIDDCERLA